MIAEREEDMSRYTRRTRWSRRTGRELGMRPVSCGRMSWGGPLYLVLTDVQRMAREVLYHVSAA